jgi:MraZ protein
VPATFDPKKARLSVPSGFRSALAAQGSLELIGRRSSHSPCIEIWPKATFDAEVKQRTAHLDPFSREFEKLMRRLVAHAHALLPDAEGRMVLPKELIEKAGLESDVVFTGRHSFFQLWSAKSWEAAIAEDDAEESET